MPEGFEDYINNKMLDYILRATDPSLGATLYIALYEAGSEVSTGVWTNYARVAVTRNTTNFPAAASGDSSNSTLIDFGTATVTGGPQDVDEVRIFDASAAGNGFWRALLNTPKSINDSDPVTIPIGDLDFSYSQT